jgi:hypothetical protein
VNATALLERPTALGFSLTLAPGGVRVTPASQLTEEHRQAIRACKPELLALLKARRALDCLQCRRPLDAARACWKCCDRVCHCGRPTGSAFIELCRPCEVAWLRLQGIEP